MNSLALKVCTTAVEVRAMVCYLSVSTKLPRFAILVQQKTTELVILL